MRLRWQGKSSAFTLLEVLISVGLMVLLLSVMFRFFWRSLDQRDATADVSKRIQLSRVVLNRIVDEIRQAVASIPAYGVGLMGYDDSIEINTIVVPDRKLSERRDIRDAKLASQFDLMQIRYYIAWDYENVDTNGDPRPLGLVRRESRTYLRDVVFEDEVEESAEAEEQATVGIAEELYAPEIQFLEFRYFDGAKWWDKWELAQANAVPQMVQVTIGYVAEIPDEEDDEIVDEDFLNDDADLKPLPDDRQTVIVRLKQADVFFGSRVSKETSAFVEDGL